MALYAYIELDTQSYIFDSIASTPVTQAALVLGASVTAEGQLSPILQERADQAIALYNAQKVSKILVTGDNATLSHDEVDPVGKYMAANGVPKDDIFLDHAGFDTYSSMYRARDVFDVTSLTVVSQPFHLPRAVFIARSLGLVAYASPAPHDGLDLYNWLREIPASVKATYDILFSRVPKYLGWQYPIQGNGEDTWGGFSTTTVWQ
jgi:SanA protein